MTDGKRTEGSRRRLARRLRQVRLDRRSLLISLAVLAVVIGGYLVWRSPTMLAENAAPVTFFQIATGSTAGTYYPVGEVIATMISEPSATVECEDGARCGVPGLLAVVKSSEGSIANVRNVASGIYDAALAQADIVAWAHSGLAIFSDEPSLANLRAIASLYAEAVHLVASRESGIKRVTDLVGKRVSLDRSGSGTRADANLILDAFGVSQDDLTVVEASPSVAVDMIREGTLDAFFLVAGTPASAVRELADAGLINLVPITGDAVERLRSENTFFVEHHVPPGTYAGVPAVRTVSVNALLITASEAPISLVRDITAALWRPENRPLLEQGHQKGRLIRPETALDGIPIPLHPGAERFYRSAGML